MTQLPISDELAANIAAKAAENRCTTEDLLQSLLYRLEADEAFAEALSTTDLGHRIAADLKEVDRGHFTTSEEVDKKFEALYQRLRSK